MPAEGVNPCELPEIAEPVWDAFLTLRNERAEGFNGPRPLTSRNLLDWMRIERVILEPWQIDAIRRLDLMDLSSAPKGKPKTAPAGK